MDTLLFYEVVGIFPEAEKPEDISSGFSASGVEEEKQRSNFWEGDLERWNGIGE